MVVPRIPVAAPKNSNVLFTASTAHALVERPLNVTDCIASPNDENAIKLNPLEASIVAPLRLTSSLHKLAAVVATVIVLDTPGKGAATVKVRMLELDSLAVAKPFVTLVTP